MKGGITLLKINKGVKRRLSILLVLVMILSQPAFAMTPNINESHWAYGTMISLVKDKVFSPMASDWGLEEPITRQEFVRLINKAYGNQMEGTVSFSDVSSDSLYYKDIAKAVANGMVSGYPDGTFKPMGSLTRQEAAAVLAKMTRKDNVMTGVVNAFSDGPMIPDWSQENMAWMIQNKYMSGYPDGTIGYDQPITYAESLALVSNILGNRIVEASTDGNGQTISGNVSVLEPNVTLSNMVINGDLMISGQVGDGDVTLDNVEIKGRLIVYGGGQNSIKLFNTIVSQLVVSRFEAPVRIVADNNSSVRDSVVETSSILEAPPSVSVFRSVIVQPSIVNMAIDLRGTFEDIAVSNIQQQLNLSGVDSQLPVKINIPLGSVIKTLRVAAKAEIEGSGQIDNADIQVNDIKVNVRTSNFKLGNGVSKVIVNNKSVGSVSEANSAGRSPVTGGTTGGTTGGATGGGGSGGSSNRDDDDNTVSPSTIQFDSTTTSQSANEGDSSANSLTFTVNRTGNTAASATVNFTVAGSGTNSASTTDYTVQTTSPITFAANVTSQAITVNTVPDTTAESDETFTVTLTSAGGNGQLGTEKTATGTIVDDDTTPITAPGAIAFEDMMYYATEGDTIVLTLVRTGGTDGIVTVTLDADTQGGSAESGDYTLTLPQTITFADGIDEVTVSIPTNVDADSDDELLLLELSNPTGGATLGTQDYTDVNIYEPGNVTSGAGIRFNMTLDEVDEGETAQLTMERNDTSEAVTVDYTIIPGTATASDYIAPDPLQVTFAQGSSIAQILIDTTDDSVIDSPDEKAFSVRLDSATGSEEVSSTYNTANVNILDDDMEFAFTVPTDSVDEGSDITLIVNRLGISDGPASVDYVTSNGAAIAGDDYTASSGTLNFASSDITKTITITTLTDTITDDGENFIVTLSNPTASSTYEASLGDYDTSTIVINDVASTNLVLNGITHHSKTWIEANFDRTIVDTLTTPSAVAVTSGASLITSGAAIVTTDSAIEITDLTRNTLDDDQLSISFSRDVEHGMEITFYSIIEAESGALLGEGKTYIFDDATDTWGLVTN